MNAGDRMEGAFHRKGEIRRLILATLIPLATLAMQWIFWSSIQPYVWFLFYPAVFFSAWVGGMRGGVMATAISLVSVWWFFIPTRNSFTLERVESAISMGVFVCMGVLFSLAQEQLRKAQRQAQAALADAASANEELEKRVRERTSDLLRTVAALKESEGRLQLFIEHAPVALAMFDREMRYLAVSRRWLVDFVVGEREIIGRSHYDIFPEISDDLKEVHRRALGGEVIRSEEDRFERADGSIQWLRWEVRPWHTDNGQVGGIVIFTEHISARKQAEEEIRKLNTELEQRVAERTRELRETQLALMNLVDDLNLKAGELSAANKELETFSYSVSHDLKAPLRGIDGYSRLLEEECGAQLNKEGRRFLSTIRRSAAQMHQLIEDLLDYSRLERRELHKLPFDLAALIEKLVAERAAETEQAGILLRVEVPPLMVHADRDGLIVALRNLLENALKFSRNATPPTIEIGARVEREKVLLWVRDNGIGFDMKYHDRIFEIFQRLQRAEDYPGTGIGLALVRKAMQRMGGRVWAESSPREGATFYLEIPA